MLEIDIWFQICNFNTKYVEPKALVQFSLGVEFVIHCEADIIASLCLWISFHLCMKARSALSMIGRALTCERQDMSSHILAYGHCFAAFVSCIGEI